MSKGLIQDNKATKEIQKKQARISASLATTNSKTGFLHAVLLLIDDLCIAITGPSGSGKSTLANFLAKEFSGEIIANDWVAIEKKSDQLYASDLNKKSLLRHKKPYRLDAIVVLTNHDELSRDAFSPSADEFNDYLMQCFDAMLDTSSKKLCKFWNQNFTKLPFLAILPTRDNSLKHTKQTLKVIVKRIRPSGSLIDVGVIGTGSVGSVLVSEIGKLPYINHVHLYNRTKKVALGLAMDLNQSLYRGRSDIFVAHSKEDDVFKNSQDVFFVFRDKYAKQTVKDMPERWNKIATHSKVAAYYSRLASKAKFTGTIFVITNPVDIITYGCFYSTKKSIHSLRTFQVYGIGLEGDIGRAMFYARNVEPTFTLKNIKMFGNHTDRIVCKTNLSKNQNDKLLELINDASAELRKYVSRTIYGPVSAALRTHNAFIEGNDCYATVIQEGAHMGRHIKFRYGLPQLASELKDVEYNEILSENQRLLKRFEHYFK
jgi:malate/lactate dehydrogenase